MWHFSQLQDQFDSVRYKLEAEAGRPRREEANGPGDCRGRGRVLRCHGAWTLLGPGGRRAGANQRTAPGPVPSLSCGIVDPSCAAFSAVQEAGGLPAVEDNEDDIASSTRSKFVVTS